MCSPYSTHIESEWVIGAGTTISCTTRICVTHALSGSVRASGFSCPDRDRVTVAGSLRDRSSALVRPPPVRRWRVGRLRAIPFQSGGVCVRCRTCCPRGAHRLMDGPAPVRHHLVRGDVTSLRQRPAGRSVSAGALRRRPRFNDLALIPTDVRRRLQREPRCVSE